MFFSNFVAPWQETFADARDGDGEGDHLGPFGTIFEPLWDNFGSYGMSLTRLGLCQADVNDSGCRRKAHR